MSDLILARASKNHPQNYSLTSTKHQKKILPVNSTPLPVTAQIHEYEITVPNLKQNCWLVSVVYSCGYSVIAAESKIRLVHLRMRSPQKSSRCSRRIRRTAKDQQQRWRCQPGPGSANREAFLICLYEELQGPVYITYGRGALRRMYSTGQWQWSIVGFTKWLQGLYD